MSLTVKWTKKFKYKRNLYFYDKYNKQDFKEEKKFNIFEILNIYIRINILFLFQNFYS